VAVLTTGALVAVALPFSTRASAHAQAAAESAELTPGHDAAATALAA